jgi:peptidoglycan hydrolase CwlO-like protein
VPVDGRIGVGQAAIELGMSTQGVRDLIRAKKLQAIKSPKGQWRIEPSSVQRHLRDHGQKPGKAQFDVDALHKKVDDLADSIDALMAERKSSTQLLEALEQERDRHRADAVASRAAALGLLASTQDTHSAIEDLLGALSKQGDVLTQFLTPGSLQDLMP